jgi:phosphoribosylformylglycinamidine cyclo-ligase
LTGALAAAPIFTLIQQAGNVADTEMFRTFNMGIGMVLVVAREDALQIVEQLRASGERAAIIGEVLRGSNEVQVV